MKTWGQTELKLKRVDDDDVVVVVVVVFIVVIGIIGVVVIAVVVVFIVVIVVVVVVAGIVFTEGIPASFNPGAKRVATTNTARPILKLPKSQNLTQHS